VTDRPVRVGVQLQPQHADYAEIRRAVAEAEEVGVDVVFNRDHFFPLYGNEIERSAGVSPRPGRFSEDVRDYVAAAEDLHAVGTRLFTVGPSGPRYDLAPIRDLVAWRDSRNTG